MKIVIDCRYTLSGIGRYLEGVVNKINFNNNEYYLLGKKEFVDRYENTHKIYSDLDPFSPKSLFCENAKEINKCDVFFTPNFIIPYGIKIKVYSTIHDVIFLDDKTSTNGTIDHMIKKHLLKRCAKKSKKIFTVSNFSKDRINYHLKKSKNKVIVTYSGLSDNILNYKDIKAEKEDYIVFVGNIKKNKGLSTLVKAIENTNIKLIIIGKQDNYRTSDKNLSSYLKNKNISFSGSISDEELISILSKAKFLVSPSTYEGFGLPPLEALYLNTKPIISDIDVYKEIYSNLDVIYFKVNDSLDLKEKILTSDHSITKKEFPLYTFENASKTIINEIEGDIVD